MNTPNQRSKRPDRRCAALLASLAIILTASTACAADFAVVCTDRAAIERVYYNHRTGTKPPFEQTLPPATLESLVRQDLRKEAALKRAYHVEVTAAMLDTEVRRIDTTTRAPEMLAEIKAALGDDPARFANAFAKPILVERLLREKFENDDALHLPQRRLVEQTRNELLAAKTNDTGCEKLLALLKRSNSNRVTETTWQLAARPEDSNPTGAELMEVQRRFGAGAQLLSTPQSGATDHKFYFGDLPGELQNLLRVQLRQAGDVSAVIETPGGFLLYVAREKTGTELSVAGLSLPKRSYETWLEEQNANTP